MKAGSPFWLPLGRGYPDATKSDRSSKEDSMRLLMGKRIVVWAVEMILQGLLVGLFLICLFGYDRYAFARGWLTYTVAIMLMFAMTGYLITTIVLRTVWRTPAL